MVPEIPVPAVADSGSRGNRVGLAKARVLSLASVGLKTASLRTASLRRGAQHRASRVSLASRASAGLQTANLRRVRVLSQVSAAVPRDVLHRVVLHRVRLPRGAQ